MCFNGRFLDRKQTSNCVGLAAPPFRSVLSALRFFVLRPPDQPIQEATRRKPSSTSPLLAWRVGNLPRLNLFITYAEAEGRALSAVEGAPLLAVNEGPKLGKPTVLPSPLPYPSQIGVHLKGYHPRSSVNLRQRFRTVSLFPLHFEREASVFQVFRQVELFGRSSIRQ
jgi:hypothetical protein